MGSDTRAPYTPKYGITPRMAKALVRAWLAEYGDTRIPVTTRAALGVGLVVRLHDASFPAGAPCHYTELVRMGEALGFLVRFISKEEERREAATRDPANVDAEVEATRRAGLASDLDYGLI